MSNWQQRERPSVPVTLAPIGKPKRKRVMNLTPEQKAGLVARLKAMREAPEFEEKRLAGIRKHMANRHQDPEQRAKAVKNLHSNEIKRLAKCRLANAERWADPEKRRQQSEVMKARWASGRMDQAKRVYSPEAKAKRLAAAMRGHDKKRGFKIPKHLLKEYKFLRYTKNIPSRECGRILGLI